MLALGVTGWSSFFTRNCPGRTEDMRGEGNGRDKTCIPSPGSVEDLVGAGPGLEETGSYEIGGQG